MPVKVIEGVSVQAVLRSDEYVIKASFQTWREYVVILLPDGVSVSMTRAEWDEIVEVMK